MLSKSVVSVDILIVGKGGEAIPEWERIWNEMLTLDPALASRILVDDSDYSMHTGMNVTTVAKILKREGLSPEHIVLIQMPTGLRLSRRIFEFQWSEIILSFFSLDIRNL